MQNVSKIVCIFFVSKCPKVHYETPAKKKVELLLFSHFALVPLLSFSKYFAQINRIPLTQSISSSCSVFPLNRRNLYLVCTANPSSEQVN